MYEFAQARLSARHSSLLVQGDNSEGHAFTFDCHNGWAGLIDGVLHLVGRYAADLKLEVRITTVKEKFGELRIYQHGGDVIVDQAFDITEMVSGHVCELCGRPGSVMDYEGWLQARCEHHQGASASETHCPILFDEQYVSNYVGCLAIILWTFKSGAALWVQRRNIGLGGLRPREVLATVHGCEDVYLLLQRLAHGAVV
ncbi:DUF2384 domain-containing protein [Pseudomonas monteilii]|nr:DUF2384 domain-containing protein [Pseudomonas monteilii]